VSGPADFGYGDALNALWGDGGEKFLTIVVEQGVVAADIPAASGERAGWLIAWPDISWGIRAFIAVVDGGAANEFVAAWPYAATGTRHDMRIEVIHSDVDSSLVQLFETRVRGVPLTVFDVSCAGAQHGLMIGETYPVRLSAWATMLERAPTDPIVFKPDQVNDAMREAFREVFEREGQLVIHTSEMSALLSHGQSPSPLHEIQGPVTTVRLGPPLLGLTIWILTVTVARPDDGDELNVEIIVTSEIWQGDDPKVGEPVRGIAWFQATFEELGQLPSELTTPVGR
jgi:hypothetical protein